MKKLVFTLILVMGVLVSRESLAQKAKTIKLEQTPGVFTQTELELKAGKTYVFEISNSGIDHEVGFVIAPKGKTEQENHVQAAYVTELVAEGASSLTNEVVLEAGEYVYFCPLNPTPEYTLVVK